MKISKKAYQWLTRGIFTSGLLASLIICCNLFVFSYIPSGSMIPTLKIHEVCVFWRTKNVERGDVVLFYPYPDDKDERYVKRVIAFGGDTVSIQNGTLFLNGEIQDEPYLNEKRMNQDMLEYTVPDGCFFAMGDNRNHSTDSRYFGAFFCDRLIGKVILHF